MVVKCNSWEHLQLQAPKFGSNDHSVTHHYRQLWANYRNDYSLPLIILTKTDILIKSENLEIKNKIIKTLQKWIISYKVF